MSPTELQIPPELFGKIMLAVYDERKRLAACRRFAAASVICTASFAALVPMTGLLYGEFLASSFGHFLLLLVWDTRAVAAHWQDYGLSLLESFPALYAAAFLSIILALLLSAKFIAKYMRFIRRIKPAASRA